MSTLQIYYDTGDDSQNTNDGTNHPIAQTFTTVGAYTISSVSAKMYKAAGATGTVTLSIRATDGTLPTGEDLTSGTINFSAITESSPGNWYTATLTPYALSATTKYAVVYSDNQNTDKINYRQQMVGGYAGGGEYTFNVAGQVWNTGASARDLMFRTYSSAAGPANLKTYNTNTLANIKTINTNVIANVKTLNTNA